MIPPKKFLKLKINMHNEVDDLISLEVIARNLRGNVIFAAKERIHYK